MGKDEDSKMKVDDPLSALGEAIDTWLMAPWKGHLTIPFPAFHARNVLSGWFQSVSDGHVSAAEITKGYVSAALHFQKGKAVEP